MRIEVLLRNVKCSLCQRPDAYGLRVTIGDETRLGLWCAPHASAWFEHLLEEAAVTEKPNTTEPTKQPSNSD